MSNIAILGSGRVAKALAGGLAAAGHCVVIGSRTPETTTEGWDGPEVDIRTIESAIADAAVVFNATPGESALQRLSALRDELADKILVDVSNAVERGEGGAPGSLVYPNSSLAERLQEALPATAVVKSLNTMLFMVMVAPSLLEGTPTVFVSGDDDDAKSAVKGILADLGWPSERVLDLGGINTARGPEALILLVPDVLRARGFAPFAIGVVS